MMWLIIGLSWKITKIRTIPLLFETKICSATSMECFCRDLLNDMADHGLSLKNNQNTHYSLIFRDEIMFSHIIQKVSARAFHWCGWKITKIRSTPVLVSHAPNSYSISKKLGFHFYCVQTQTTLTISNAKFPKASFFPVLMSVERIGPINPPQHYSSQVMPIFCKRTWRRH